MSDGKPKEKKQISKTQEVLSGNIAALRKKNELTQGEFAEKLNVGASTISGWETGRKAPSLEDLEKMAGLFGVTVSDLFTDKKNTSRQMQVALSQSDFLRNLYALVFSSAVKEFSFNEFEEVDVNGRYEYVPTFRFTLNKLEAAPMFAFFDGLSAFKSNFSGADAVKYVQSFINDKMAVFNNVPLELKNVFGNVDDDTLPF